MALRNSIDLAAKAVIQVLGVAAGCLLAWPPAQAQCKTVNSTSQLTGQTAIALVMDHTHRLKTFAENGFGYVGMCAGCRTINVAFQNSLFCLTIEQFEAFADMMNNRLAMRPISTTNGKELMLPTPMPNYFLLFSAEDLTNLCALLNEAAPVLEAERILNLSQRLN